MEQNEVSGKTLRSLLEHFQPSVVDMNGKQPIPTSMSEGALPAFLYRLGNAASISSSSSSPSMVVKSNAFALEDSTIRRTRTVIPYSVKCQITKLAEENPRITQGEIAQIFGIDRTTVSKILKRRREFSEDPIHSSDMPTNSKLRRFSSELLNHEKHEEEVYIWYKKLNLKNVVVTHSMIMEAAKTLAGTYGMSKTDFNKQWLISFLEKYNITKDVRTDPLTEGITHALDSETLKTLAFNYSLLQSAETNHGFNISSLSGSKSPKFQKAKNERKSHISTSLSSDGLLPKGQRLSQQKESDSASSSLVIKIPRDQLVMPPVESPKQHEDKHSPVDQVTIKQEVDEVPQEINDEEALSREMGNLEKFREQQKMIEEANKQRKALLSKTLSERQKRARQEAAKLAHIQKELQLLDNRLTADVTVIRSRIELASRDFLEAQKRYDRAEREFVDAKIDLQKKSEMKEQLTEHLYTIIHQNEVRKAGKLSELMGELEMEAKEDGVQLPELPPLATFNTITTLQALQSPKSPSDILSSLHKHMKDMTSSSSEAAESVSSQDGKREGKTTDENDENENPVNLTCPISKEKERNKSLTEKGQSDTLVKEGNSKTEYENDELTESNSNSKNLSNSRENHIDSIQSVEGEKEKSADSEILNESVSRQLETTGDMCPGESSASGSISPNVTLDSNIQIKKEIID